MTSANSLYIFVVVITVVSAIYSLIDFRSCPDRKQLVRLFGAVLFFYLAGVYIAVLINPDDLLLRSGVLSRYGIVVVAFLFILEIWIDRRGKHAN